MVSAHCRYELIVDAEKLLMCDGGEQREAGESSEVLEPLDEENVKKRRKEKRKKKKKRRPKKKSRTEGPTEIGEQFQFLIFDNRGIGRSDAPSGMYRYLLFFEGVIECHLTCTKYRTSGSGCCNAAPTAGLERSACDRDIHGY